MLATLSYRIVVSYRTRSLSIVIIPTETINTHDTQRNHTTHHQSTCLINIPHITLYHSITLTIKHHIDCPPACIPECPPVLHLSTQIITCLFLFSSVFSLSANLRSSLQPTDGPHAHTRNRDVKWLIKHAYRNNTP